MGYHEMFKGVGLFVYILSPSLPLPSPFCLKFGCDGWSSRSSFGPRGDLEDVSHSVRGQNKRTELGSWMIM